jgi:hypothetical protein
MAPLAAIAPVVARWDIFPETSVRLFALGLEAPYSREWRLALLQDTDEARNGRPVVGAIGTAERSDEAPLCRRRLFARHADLTAPNQ